MRRIAIALFFVAIALGSVPLSLPFTGRLTDASGTGITGSREIIFSIYDSETGGSLLWCDTVSVTVTNSLFETTLGDAEGDGVIEKPVALPFDIGYHVQMAVAGEVMLPRVPISTEAYAHRAVYADTAEYTLSAITSTASFHAQVITDQLDLCSGGSLILGAVNSGGTPPITHAWTGETGPLSATDVPNPTFYTEAAGVYHLTYAATDDDGNTAEQTIAITVHANPTPSIDASPASGGCSGRPVVLTVNGCYDKYCWYPAGNLFNNYTYAESSGVYSVVVTDGNGCQGSDDITVTFLPPPTCDAGPNIGVCFDGGDPAVGGSPSASGGTPPYFYEWTGTGSPYLSSTSSANPTFDISAAGIGVYNLTLSITDGNGCTNDDGPIAITVYGLPTAAASSNSPVCPGGDILLTATPSGGTSPYTFSWTGPDGFSSDMQNPTVSGATSSSAGTYTVTVTDAHACSGTAASTTVVLRAFPTVTSHPVDAEVTAPATATFSVTATGEGLTYQWQLNTGSGWADIGGAVSSSFTTGTTSLGMDGYQYRCIVSGTCEPPDTSDPATLTINAGLFDFTSHTFTNCGATGRYGPTLSQCRSAYSTPWDEDDANFNMSSQGIQVWTIPMDGSYRITAAGAKGGGVSGGGSGAIMAGTFTLTAGDVLQITVGQMGIQETYEGGSAGGGGGGSYVVSESNVPMVIAGGGGGSGSPGNAGGNAITTQTGSLTGAAGMGGTPGEGNSGAGFTGNGILGAHGGTTAAYSFVNGCVGGYGDSGGGYGEGGFGGGGGDGYYDGGGGGGYSGGGTGGNTQPGYGAGSYNVGTSPSNSVGNSGHGYVIIEYLD